MGTIYFIILELSNFPAKKGFLAAILGNICLRCSSRSWIRCGEISCAPHTSSDELDDSVVKPKRGELVRGSDSPFVYSAHTTAGDVWRAPTRLLLKKKLAAGAWKTETKTQKLSTTSQRARNRYLRGFGGRPQDNAGNLSRPRAWINMNSSALAPTLA